MMYHRYLFEAIVPVRTLSIVLAGVEAEIMAGRQNVSGHNFKMKWNLFEFLSRRKFVYGDFQDLGAGQKRSYL